MGWFEDIKRYRDERHEIIQLRYEIRRLGDEFKKKSEGMKRRSQEFQILLSEYSAEASLSQSRIEELETVQLVRRAIKWGVPIPTRPYQEEKEDDEFWDWDYSFGKYFLKPQAKSYIRKEVYQEWEMWWKPWLSWIAIMISVISLFVAFFRS